MSRHGSRYSVLLLFFCRAIAVPAQADGPCTFVLQGRVLDEHDRSPLPYAEVRLVEAERSTTADEQGRFRLEGVCPGTWTLYAVHVGCEPVTRRVVVQGDVWVDLFLEHHAEELHDLEVARSRPDEHVGQAHTGIGSGDMEKSSGRTLGEMLATVPGVNVLNSGPTISKPVIHGLSGNRILILNQGIRQEDQQWGTEHAPNLDPFSSDRITVVKGAASVQYGSDAIGGVVITEPVELPREPGLGGEVRGVGMLNGRGGGGNAMLQGGVRGLRGIGWRVQGSGRYLGDSEAPGYVLSNTGVREVGTSASIGYRDHRWNASAYYSYFGRELGIVRASHIGNLTDLNNAITSGRPWYVADFTYGIDAPRQQVEHHLLKAEAGLAVSERGRFVLTYGYQGDHRQEYDIRRGGRSGIPALDLFLATHTADAVLKHWIGRQVHGKIGVSAVVQENDNIPGTGVRPLIPDHRKESGGLFLIEHFPLSRTVEVEAGGRIEGTHLEVARYDDGNVLVRPAHAFVNNAFSMGASWAVKDSVRLRFNLGSAYRPPNVSELYSEGLHHGAAAIEEGDDRLKSERSLKGTIDLEASWLGGRLRTDVTLYADRIGNYIYLRPDGMRLTVRGAFPVLRYVATDAMLYGLDASIRFRFTERWSFRSRMSTVHGRDLLQGGWLFLMPGDRMENAVLFERPAWGAWSALEVAATSLLVLEQRRVPPGVDFTGPPGTYHLAGLSASVTRALGTGELRIGLRATNLLNTSYRDYMDRFRYYADARGLDLALWITYRFGKGRS